MKNIEAFSVKLKTFTYAVVAIMVGIFILLALKLFGQNFSRSELALLFVRLAVCGVAAFRFQQRRQRRQLDLIRDSALW